MVKKTSKSSRNPKTLTITIVNTNQGEKGTCGSCHYTNNKLGFVALHCTCENPRARKVHWDEYGKVRSWESCACWRGRDKEKCFNRRKVKK